MEADTVTQNAGARTPVGWLYLDFTNHTGVAGVAVGSQSFQSSLCETSHTFAFELELIIGFCSVSENYLS